MEEEEEPFPFLLRQEFLSSERFGAFVILFGSSSLPDTCSIGTSTEVISDFLSSPASQAGILFGGQILEFEISVHLLPSHRSLTILFHLSHLLCQFDLECAGALRAKLVDGREVECKGVE